MITLYQFEISPYCDKVRRILHAKGVEYTVREVSMQEAVTLVRRVNPAGKLPALEIDGQTFGDSTAIAHMLEERYPNPRLIPENPRDRGLCHALEDWADESLYFYEMYLRFTIGHNSERWVPVLCANDSELFRKAGRFVIPRHMKGILGKQGIGRKTREEVVADVARHVDAVQGLVEGREWLIGDALTLADIAVFAQLFCIRGAREGAAALAQSPEVEAWMERVDQATQPPQSERVRGVG